MAYLKIPTFLIGCSRSSTQRAHFSIFIPSSPDYTVDKATLGVKLHVVGTPMMGFELEVRKDYNPAQEQSLSFQVGLGDVSIGEGKTVEDVVAEFVKVAERIPPPRKSENFLAPVNNVSCKFHLKRYLLLLGDPANDCHHQITNRRCQEWTMDFVRKLVQSGWLPAAALDEVQRNRDPPSHGIGLRPVKRD